MAEYQKQLFEANQVPVDMNGDQATKRTPHQQKDEQNYFED